MSSLHATPPVYNQPEDILHRIATSLGVAVDGFRSAAREAAISPLLLKITPVAARNAVGMVLDQCPDVIRALESLTTHIQVSIPHASMELVSDPIDAHDPPLLLTIRIPGDRPAYQAQRATLLEWWDLQHEALDPIVLILPLPQG